MLVGNGSRTTNVSPAMTLGLTAPTVDGRGRSPAMGLMSGQGSWDGSTLLAAKSAIPRGYTHPAAWVLPREGGDMATAFQAILGEATVSANLAGGYNLSAALTGSGDVTSAALGLVVSAVAALTGSATVVAAITGKLEAAAALTGSASVVASLGALADLVASLSGSTTVVAGITAKGSMTSDINASATLTVGAIADAGWDEVLSGHLTAGTTGAALNGAGSAGDPWGTALPGAYGAGSAGKLIGDLLASGSVDGLDVLEALRIGLAVLAGKTSGFAAGAGTRTVRSVDDTKDRLVAVQDASANRTSTTLDGS